MASAVVSMFLLLTTASHPLVPVDCRMSLPRERVIACSHT